MILQSGECERLKGGVHAVALTVAAVMASYNLAAWLIRRERHLAGNAILYVGLTLFEVQQVRHHRARVPRDGRS